MGFVKTSFCLGVILATASSYAFWEASLSLPTYVSVTTLRSPGTSDSSTPKSSVNFLTNSLTKFSVMFPRYIWGIARTCLAILVTLGTSFSRVDFREIRSISAICSRRLSENSLAFTNSAAFCSGVSGASGCARSRTVSGCRHRGQGNVWPAMSAGNSNSPSQVLHLHIMCDSFISAGKRSRKTYATTPCSPCRTC